MPLPRPVQRATCVLVVLTLLLGLSACHRTFLYPADKPPVIKEGYATVEREDRSPRKYRIKRIQVLRQDKQLAQPNAQELEAIQNGQPHEGLDTLVLRVDSGVDIWNDYAVPGFWVGAILGGVLGAMLGWELGGYVNEYDRSSSRRAAHSALIGLTMGLGFGVEFMGFGALLGGVFNPKQTDMRGAER